MPTLKLESQKHTGNKTKINRDQETQNISVCTKFEQFIFIHEAMNAEQGHPYAPSNSFGRGQNHKFTPGYLGKMSSGCWG